MISSGTITKILDKYDDSGSVNNNWKGWRPKLLNAQETKKIVKASKKNRLLTAAALAKNKKINISGASESTVKRALKDQGLMASTAIPRYVSPKNKVARVKFARDWL